MPIYEYRCGGCNAISSKLVYSWSPTSALECPECGGADLERLMSAFSFRASWGDSLNWVPSGETARDVDENSAASIDQHMGRIKREMGGQTTSDFDRMRREIKDN
jgi:putative FmdB family regulatory protein